MSAKPPIESIEQPQANVRQVTYTVFPGVTLTYNTVSSAEEAARPPVPPDVLEISHCREGRVECAFGERLTYLAPGDLSIICGAREERTAAFPLGHFKGVHVRLNAAEAPRCLSCLLDDVNVRPELLIHKFCATGRTHFVRGDPRIAHIFDELYNVPEEIKLGYLKVKLLELLLFLSVLDVEPEAADTPPLVSRPQADLAKAVCRYLTDHMDSRVTLEHLSEHFHVSGTGIKNSFKAVYGMSVYAYIRTQKMQAAARLLRETDRSVLDIAGSFGYDNGSKFAKAFRDCCGVSPNEFRRNGGKCLNGAEKVEIL